MPRSTTTYRIFVSSPGDTKREREAMRGVANAMNGILEDLLPEDGIAVDLRLWEDIVPLIADGAQPVVDAQIDSYDIYLGILAKRFGTPTARAASGTEDEFRRACELHRKHGMPQIVFYFNTQVDPPQEPDKQAQFEKVKAFRAELQGKGIVGEYNGADLFGTTVLPVLLRLVGRLLNEDRAVQQRVSVPSAPPSWSVAGQPVPIGRRVKVAAIGEKDACYRGREKYIGQTGIVLEAQPAGRWLRGTFQFDQPLIPGDDGRYLFLQFQITEP